MSTGSAISAIALGSNLGDRLSHIRAGIAGILGLPATRLVSTSSIIQTPALVRPGSGPQPDYLNAVLLIQTGLAPRTLLEHLLGIECRNGRDRSETAAGSGEPSRWQPRTLDLDILFYEDLVVSHPSLTIPHPHMHERLFVLEPLAQVAPDWVHPTRGQTVAQMLRQVKSE